MLKLLATTGDGAGRDARRRQFPVEERLTLLPRTMRLMRRTVKTTRSPPCHQPPMTMCPTLAESSDSWTMSLVQTTTHARTDVKEALISHAGVMTGL